MVLPAAAVWGRFRGLCYTAPQLRRSGPRALRKLLLMCEFRRALVVAAALAIPAICAAGSKPDIENGKATFNTMCGVCHSVQETGGPREGPNLLGVVGRKAASEPDFAKYSPALKASGITWSNKDLDNFLLNPMAKVPGTFMPMLIPDDKTRADVVAYLETLKKK